MTTIEDYALLDVAATADLIERAAEIAGSSGKSWNDRQETLQAFEAVAPKIESTLSEHFGVNVTSSEPHMLRSCAQGGVGYATVCGVIVKFIWSPDGSIDACHPANVTDLTARVSILTL